MSRDSSVLMTAKDLFKSAVKPLVPEVVEDILRTIARSRDVDKGYLRGKYLGNTLEIKIVDELSTAWYDRDLDAEYRKEFAKFEELGIPSDALVFNLGAHQGLVAMLLKRIVVPDGRVIAVDIDRKNVAACNDNFSRNRLGDAECIHAAISDKNSFVQAKVRSCTSIEPKFSALKGILGMKVRSITIDKMCAEFGAPEFIYMDVEGAETLAVRGSTSALKRVANWYIELHENEGRRYGGSNRTVVETFIEHGYLVLISLDGEFYRIENVGDVPSERCYMIATRTGLSG